MSQFLLKCQNELLLCIKELTKKKKITNIIQKELVNLYQEKYECLIHFKRIFTNNYNCIKYYNHK